jgi:hypothetical protein
MLRMPTTLMVLALLTGCTASDPETPEADPSDVFPEAELTEDGAVTAANIALKAELSSHMGTVVHVTWEHAWADVVYDSDGDQRRTAGVETAEGYEA